VAIGSRIAFARDVGSGEDRSNSRLGQGGCGIQGCNAGMGVWSENRPCMQSSRKTCEQIVRIQRFAGYVSARAFVGNGLSLDAYATPSFHSHQNFSTRLFATSRRYSAEPR
jgi:hypothetical protein